MSSKVVFSTFGASLTFGFAEGIGVAPESVGVLLPAGTHVNVTRLATQKKQKRPKSDRLGLGSRTR